MAAAGTLRGRRYGARTGSRGLSLTAALVNTLRLDLRSLAALRIGLAAVVIVQVLYDSVYLRAFWTDDGLIPRAGLLQIWRNSWIWSLHFASGGWQVVALLVTLQVAAAVCLLIGFRTRTATVLLWVLVASLQTRNPIVLDASDGLLRLMLFWGIFLPWGARFSLDAARRGGPQGAGGSVLTGGSIAYMLQFCFMYWFTAVLKSGREWHGEATAVYYALSLDMWATPFARLLLGHPDLLALLTRATLVAEFVAPLLFFVPVRNGLFRMVGILVLLGLQAGFRLGLELALFPLISSAALLGFLPPGFWERVMPLVRGRGRLRLPSALSGPLRRAVAAPSAAASPPGEGRPSGAVRAWLRNGVPLALLAYALLWNLNTVDETRFTVPAPLRPVGWLLRLDQSWTMFAPHPFTDDGWYVIPAVLRDGRNVDLFQDGGAVSWEKPERVAAEFDSYRWRKYLNNLYLVSYAEYRLYYGQYLCRTWNERHTGGAQLIEFRIVYMLERTPPPGQAASVEPVELWQHWCFERPAQPT